MNNQATECLAFDVHQATVVATVRDEHGAIRMRATVPTESSAILGLGIALARNSALIRSMIRVESSTRFV